MIQKTKRFTLWWQKNCDDYCWSAGIGKTTLALSALRSHPLLDIDDGVSRVEARYRTDTLVANNYEELLKDLKERLKSL